jgi:DNA helicase-2/ATP-dependent DNA helicase PcrA
MPAVYSDVAELGTLFHANLEQAFLSGSELDYSNWSEEEKKLGVNFKNSRFAALSPFLVEESIEFALGGSIVVCKLDAVYLIDGEYQVVDWKSGKMPAGKELSDKAIQLSLYRIALSRKLGVPLERIRASFFYAASGEELEPQLIGEVSLAQKLELLRKAHQSLEA